MEIKHTKKLAYIPVDLLWEYREFKRDEISVPKVPFMNMYDVDEVIEYVRTNGLEPLELSVVGERALLTDGNHRIAAAKHLGYYEIPVNVMVYFGEGREAFFDHTLERFRPVDKALENLLKNLFL
jgi:hypothetical protein